MSNIEFPQARSLTNVEFEALRAAGLDPVFMSEDERKSKSPIKVRVDMADWMKQNIYTLPEEYPQGDLIRLSEETYLLTYGKEAKAAEETKNS